MGYIVIGSESKDILDCLNEDDVFEAIRNLNLDWGDYWVRFSNLDSTTIIQQYLGQFYETKTIKNTISNVYNSNCYLEPDEWDGEPPNIAVILRHTEDVTKKFSS